MVLIIVSALYINGITATHFLGSLNSYPSLESYRIDDINSHDYCYCPFSEWHDDEVLLHFLGNTIVSREILAPSNKPHSNQ